MNYTLFILASVIAVSWTATLAPTIPPPGCIYNGVYHTLGTHFQDSPCEPCECMIDGRVSCMVIDCFFVPCVDSIHEKGKCCPTCPNGENCQYSDGTVIKKGDVYHPDANTNCTCPEHNFGFGMAPNAICIKSPA